MKAELKENMTQKQYDDLRIGVDTIQTEIDGLNELKSSLDDNFIAAIDAIHTMKQGHKGRLIVAGIGKSGHIAKKIVATLASTGTPSHFVHANEASHGDLGMITKDDVVLMISNSGENPELSDLIRYTRRFNMTMIGMTSRQDSSLAKHCDILLLLPQMKEACPNNQAPTTSTTMTLAYGDAIAMALLDRMDLTAEQFGVFHPGGKLGKQLLTVDEIMKRVQDVPIMNSEGTMDQAILLLTSHNMGCVIISNDGKKLDGVITDGDLKRHMSTDLLGKSVKDIMTENPKTIKSDELAVSAVNIMSKTPGQYLTNLIVLNDNEELAGLIRLQDCLQIGVA